MWEAVEIAHAIGMAGDEVHTGYHAFAICRESGKGIFAMCAEAAAALRADFSRD
jgi:hypothetical protein